MNENEKQALRGKGSVMARHVDPVTARKGTFLESFPSASETRPPDALLGFCAVAEVNLKSWKVRGEIVYTCIREWGKNARRGGVTWQVFLLP